MLPQTLSFVDIETTGGRTFYDRVIEIGILRVEDGELTKSFQTLINPQAHIPREIELLTGITASELEDAPTFRQVKDEILEMLVDSYFVAHNVRFDYSFLKNEFKRENIDFSQKHFCTVRLSRALFPSFKHHNLDSIIERFGFVCEKRHRAYDDARILFEFYQKSKNEFSQEIFEKAVAKCLKVPSTPLNLPANTLDSLPESPGVYIFYSDTGMPLYVGKSINIKERVISHFSSDIRSSTEMNIAQQVTSIESIETAGELGALLLESKLIKKLLPLYNKRSRIKQELVAVKSKINTDGYNEVFLEPISCNIPADVVSGVQNQEKYLGFFRSRRQAKDHLATLRKDHGLCDKLLGLEKTKNACFSYRLDQCNGACTGSEKPEIYNMRVVMAFSGSEVKPWPYKGPIAIEENSMNGKREYFLMDKWCYLGTVEISGFDGEKTELASDLVFDLDTYKILKQFLKNPRNSKKIKIVENGKINKFFSGDAELAQEKDHYKYQ